MEQKKPAFILPSWADWVIALLAAFGIWRFMEYLFQPTTTVTILLITLVVKILVILVTYFLVWVFIRTLAEPSRLYVQGLNILNGQVRPDLKVVEQQFHLLQQLSGGNQAAIQHDIETIAEALTYTQQNVINELCQKSGIALYNGMVDIRANVDALAKLMPGHVTLLRNPELVNDFAAKVAENRRGMQGYLEFIQEEARRVSAGEIFSMTTGARMLGALVNVLPKGGSKS